MGFFDALFGFFDPLRNWFFPREQFRQMNRQGIGAGARNFAGTAWNEQRFRSMVRRGQKMHARRPIGSNPEMPRSSAGRIPFHKIRPAAMLRPASRLGPRGFFSGHRNTPLFPVHRMQRMRKRM
ncbi:MAG: hypothetical protein PHH08_03330 [Candidatus ainarchaeum sp.]|nr:hypothetical protein [Candidatus ainarchaeum sp.]